MKPKPEMQAAEKYVSQPVEEASARLPFIIFLPPGAHWRPVKLLKEFPALPEAGKIRDSYRFLCNLFF